MPIPYHGEGSADISSLDTGLVFSDGISTVNELLGSIDSSETPVVFSDMVGEQTLEDGGHLGSLLRLLRVHLDDMKERQELTADIAGQVYSNMITSAMNSSLEFIFRAFESGQKNKTLAIELLAKSLDAESGIISNASLELERKAKEYAHEVLQPLEREQLIEAIEGLHIDHSKGQYELNTLLPDQHGINTSTKAKIDYETSTLMLDQHKMNETELDVKEYYYDNIQPVELDLATKSATMKQAEIDMSGKELDIRSYYHSDIQPEEKLTIIAEREIAEKNVDLKQLEIDVAGKDLLLRGKELDIKTYYYENIQPEEMASLAAEREIRQREIDVKEKEIAIKEYELSSILPSQVALNSAQTCTAQKDCDIKSYYNSTIQPLEKKVSEAKAFQEYVNAGSTDGTNSFNNEESLPYKRIIQLDKQTELYDRQYISYDDTKYQRLLETQVNFAGIIFADAETQEALVGFADKNPIIDTYNALKPPETP